MVSIQQIESIVPLLFTYSEELHIVDHMPRGYCDTNLFESLLFGHNTLGR